MVWITEVVPGTPREIYNAAIFKIWVNKIKKTQLIFQVRRWQQTRKSLVTNVVWLESVSTELEDMPVGVDQATFALRIDLQEDLW